MISRYFALEKFQAKTIDPYATLIGNFYVTLPWDWGIRAVSPS